MKCPHCLTSYYPEWIKVPLARDIQGGWIVQHSTCPECQKLVISLLGGPALIGRNGEFAVLKNVRVDMQVWPKGSMRPKCPTEVPKQFAEDYNEACLVIADSAKASAALSRRCLQNILREVAKVKPSELAREIQEMLDRGTLPSHIAEDLDAVRNIGNFAAHPIKSQHTGEVLPVEPGEAEWNLDVLESLFDFYFVQPALSKAKRDALNKKLQTAGKPAIKQP